MAKTSGLLGLQKGSLLTTENNLYEWMLWENVKKEENFKLKKQI